MTEVRLFSSTSLDGFIADEDGDSEWLEAYKPRILAASGFLEKIGAVVMGRRAFEVIRAFGDWPYEGKAAFVLSSQMLGQAPSDTSIVYDGMGAALQLARESTNKDVWIVGGALTMQSALEGGFVDIVEVCVLPVLLGTGMSLFTNLNRHEELMFDGMEVFPDGIVKLRYMTAVEAKVSGMLAPQFAKPA